MRSPVEIELVTEALAMPVMLRVLPITIHLLRAGYAPLTLMPICDPTNPKRLILLISYDYLPDLINDWLT